MGLTAMQDTPNWEQQIRFANNAGAGQYIPSSHWLGEANMNQLSLGDLGDISGVGDDQVASTINTIADAGVRIASAIQANRGKKRDRSAPAQRSQPAPMSLTSGGQGGGGSSGGEIISGVPNWVLYGGGALAIFILIFALTKKKKSSDKKEGE